MATLTTEAESSRGMQPVDPIGSCLALVSAELAAVVDVAAWTLSDVEVRDRLSDAWRVKAGIDELLARLVQAADRRDLPSGEGASSTRAWLASTLRMSRSQAAGLVAHAHALSARVETTRRAWAAGQVSAEQAVVIARTIDGLSAEVDADACATAEAVLIGHARELTHPEFRIFANHVIEVVDPDGAEIRIDKQLEADESRALDATQLRRYRRGDGTSSLTGRIPDLHADMLWKLLDTLAAPRRAGARTNSTASGTGAGSVLDVDGDHTDTETGPLTGAQRYGRAFCEVVEHLLPTDGYGSTTATIVVTIDQSKLGSGLGEASLDTGARISAAEARRLACNAAVIPTVLGGDSRILDLGMARRLFDRHQRLALTIRDRGCIWPGCGRPPAWCEAHHIKAWSQGGPTDLSNGCLLCSFHHHLLHKGEWRVRPGPDGIPELIPPARIDPHQRPLRHNRFTPMRT